MSPRRGVLAIALGAILMLVAVAAVADTFALVGGTVHPVTGADVPNGVVVVRDGKIESVGRGPAPAGVRTVDVSGKHVYPGMVSAFSEVGLAEISSVRGIWMPRSRNSLATSSEFLTS